MDLGVNGDHLTVVTYGKERPTCLDPVESCYQQNRRAIRGPALTAVMTCTLPRPPAWTAFSTAASSIRSFSTSERAGSGYYPA